MPKKPAPKSDTPTPKPRGKPGVKGEDRQSVQIFLSVEEKRMAEELARHLGITSRAAAIRYALKQVHRNMLGKGVP
jgi:hypothetical protein